MRFVHISISEANKRGISALVREAEAGHEQVVLRNNKPVVAVVSIKRYRVTRRHAAIASFTWIIFDRDNVVMRSSSTAMGTVRMSSRSPHPGPAQLLPVGTPR